MIRDGTIGKFAVELMRAQPSLTNEQVLTEVRRRFPSNQTKIASISWYRSKMKNLHASPNGHTDHVVSEPTDLLDEAIETTFGLERDLQSALRANISQLENGLTVADGGSERKVASGFIDITARDQSGATVVIELKAGPADRDAVGQILSYVGDLLEEDNPVRGILVAGEFTSRALAAARPVPNLRLVRYAFKFSFQTTSREP